ncbi:MAG: TAXI family TRAP transporter solute-binding subunit [Nitrospinota bacterium]|nr:TAXI family TRAP transporter solute-binding subunit [Nitrospinota bacterium]
MKSKLRVLIAVAASVLLISLASLGSFPTGAGGASKSIKLSAGAMGQSIYMLLAVLAKRLEEAMPGVRANVVAGGGKANPKLVSLKKVDIAFTVMGLYKNAILGKKPYKKKYSGLRVLADVQGHGAMYFMVTEDTGLTSIDQIKAKKFPLKVCTFLKSGPPEVDARRTLAEYGITYADIKKWGGRVNFSQWTDCVSMVRDGHANALLGATSLPSAFHAEAAKARKMRMLPLKEEIIQKMMKKYKYLRVILPKGLYGITPYDMPTIGTTYYFFAHKDMSDKLAYNFVKSMYNNADDVRNVHVAFKGYVAKKMATGLVGEIHPGAVKFYKEKGMLK